MAIALVPAAFRGARLHGRLLAASSLALVLPFTQAEAQIIHVQEAGDVVVEVDYANGIIATSTNANVEIVSGYVSDYGYNLGLAIFADAPGGRATVVSERILSRGRGIVAQAKNETFVASYDIASAASGILARSLESSTAVLSGLISLVNNSGEYHGAIQAYAVGPLTVVSGEITTAGSRGGFGIYATSTMGPIAVVSGSIAATGFNGYGIGSRSVSGSITIDSGSIGTSGQNAPGIFVDAGSGAVSITSGTIVTSGLFGDGITVHGGGNTSVSSGNIITSGDGSFGMRVSAWSGDISINSDSITVTGDNSQGVIVSTSGTINIDSGQVSSTASGIYANSLASIANVTSGTVTLTTSPWASAGITVYGRDGVSLVSDDILAMGSGTGRGIYAESQHGPVSIRSGSVAATGLNGYGIGSRSVSGSITIDSGSISTSGQNAPGIFVDAGSGAVSITSGSIEVGGLHSRAIRAVSTSGDIAIDSGIAVSTGLDTNVIEARSISGNISISSGTLLGSGDLNWGIWTSSDTGSVSIASGDITTSAYAITAFAYGSTADVASGRIALVNDGSHLAGGIATFGEAGSRIVSAEIVSSGTGDMFGIAGQSGSGAVSIVSGSVVASGAGGYGVWGSSGSGSVTIESANVVTTGGTRFATTSQGQVQPRYSNGVWALSQSGDISVTSGSVTTSGTDAAGIAVETGTGLRSIAWNEPGAGTTSIVSGQIVTSGERGHGIYVLGGDGSVAIDSGSVQTAGRQASAISVSVEAPPEVSVASANIQTGGEEAHGILVSGDAAKVAISSNSIETSGDRALGIVAGTLSGDISIASGSVTTLGAGSIGIVAAAGETGSVAIHSGSISTAGANAHGLLVLSEAGDVTIVSGSVETSGEAAHGIVALSAGAIDIQSGPVSVAGAGSAAIAAESAGGAISVTLAGSTSAQQGAGLRLSTDGLSTVMLVEGSTLSSGAGALIVSGTTEGGGTAILANAGRIVGQVSSTVRTDLTNIGSIEGDVLLGSHDDLVTILGGSAISGIADGGAGNDKARLVGSADTSTSGQTVGRFVNFEELEVAQGHWTAADAVGSFALVSIGAEAALELRDVEGGSPIEAVRIENGGLLSLGLGGDLLLSSIAAEGISGSGRLRLDGPGTLVVDGGGIALDGGTIVADGGLLLLSTLTGNVETAGAGIFQIGDGGTDGHFLGDLLNNGSFVFSRSDDYAFGGSFSGTGQFTKLGAGTLTFAGFYGYTGTTRVVDGGIRIAGTMDPGIRLDLAGGMLDISGTRQTISELSGSSASAIINIDAGRLTIVQDSTTEFAGSIIGDGSLVKEGEGLLNLTGLSTYTGPTLLNRGTLLVNGAIASSVLVAEGGQLGGNGSVGGISVGRGGVLRPGNSIGVLNVQGDLAFAGGSVFQVEVNAAGEADRVAVTGIATIGTGTILQVLAESGNYARRTEYTILTASGVSGTFGGVTSNLAFLTPRLSYGANAVNLTLYRNDVRFADMAIGGNQIFAAGAVQSLGIGNPVFESVLVLSDAGARTAFDALSGEVHASAPNAMIHHGRHVRNAMLGRMDGQLEGPRIWGNMLGTSGRAEARDGIAAAGTDHRLLIAGADFGGRGFRAGFAAGTGSSDLRIRDRASRAEMGTSFAGLHAGYSGAGLSVEAGASRSWHDVDSSRTVVFPGFGESLQADHDARTTQLFAEVAYALPAGPLGIAPFARLANVRSRVEGFTEAGGDSALAFDRSSRSVHFLALGVRTSGTVDFRPGVALRPVGSIAWQHAWGDLTGQATGRFGGGAPFSISGHRLAKNALDLDLGLAADFGNLTVGASYVGLVAGRESEHGGKIGVAFRF